MPVTRGTSRWFRAALAAGLVVILLLAGTTPTRITVGAEPSYTGFMVSSETGNPVGGGSAHDHIPGTLTATGTPGDIVISGHGWRFDFNGSLGVGDYHDGMLQFRVSTDERACTSPDWSLRILEAPVLVGGVVTRFAADFWRNRCSNIAPSAAMYGTIRIGSPVPPSLLHVTGALTFPETYVGEAAAQQLIRVENLGETDILVQPTNVVGTNPAEFPATDGCGPVSLDPGQSCTISVGFRPAGTTTRSAVVSIATDAYGPARSVEVSGYGRSPLLRTPSALVVDGTGGWSGVATYLDPVTMNATGDASRLTFTASDWRIAIATADGSAFAVGHYPDPAYGGQGGRPELTITRNSSSCTPATGGWLDILTAPVVDTDGTILRAAFDFDVLCSGETRPLRGWVRFHSDADRPRPGTLSFTVAVDTGSSAFVGETITVTPTIKDRGFIDQVRCLLTISGSDPATPLWMTVSSDDCAPWTFTVPPSTLGQYLVEGTLLYRENGAQGPTLRAQRTLGITTGAPVPFASNYPVQGWAITDLLTDVTPTFGESNTIRSPAGVTGCRQGIHAGYEHAATIQYGGCTRWTFALPKPTPGTVADVWQDGAHVLVQAWTGSSAWSSTTDPTSPFFGGRWGAVYRSGLPAFTGSGGVYASNLPAIFTGAARGNVYYKDEPVRQFAPVVIGATSGTCTSDVNAPYVRTVTTSGCGAFQALPPDPSMTGTISAPIRYALVSPGGVIIGDAGTEIGYVDRMAAIAVAGPDSVKVGDPLPVTASTSRGAPAAYAIVATPATGTTSAPVTRSGVFTPTIGGSGASTSVPMAGLGSGSWQLRATFTDIIGQQTTSTRLVTVVADTTPPSGSVTIAGGAAYTRTTSVTVATAATDAWSGLSQVALSNDGVAWTTRVYAASQAWTLTTTNGTKSVHVKWKDKAGNWSAVKVDTIVLDTLAPTVTAPRRGFAPGTGVTTTSVLHLRLAWTGGDGTGGSGIARFELGQQTDGGAWTTVSTTLTSPAATRSVQTGHTYRFRVRGVDRAGNVGAWVTGSTLTVRRYQESSSRIAYSGTWRTSSGSVFLGGATKRSSSAGAKASLTFSGRSIAWVARKGPDRGKAAVYVNGIKVATVDLYAASYQNRRVVWVGTFASTASRKVTIKVLGTSGRPRVDLDAFITVD